jgi:hypothetical protein
MTTTRTTFLEATAIRADADADGAAGDFTWDVPDGWQQGRGAFGGIVLGAMVRAAEASEADRGRRPRVVTGELCGPALPGPATIRVAHLRRGSGVTFAEARVLQGGEVIARASVALAGDRKLDAPAITRAAPRLPPPSTIPAANLPVPPAPPCSRHFVLLPTCGLPFAGAAGADELPRAGGYLAFRAPLAAHDAAAVVGLCDAWWPALYASLVRPRPMGTISFTAELIADPSTLAAGLPLAYAAQTDAVAGGYVVEQRELWQDGRLVALNHQTIAIIA